MSRKVFFIIVFIAAPLLLPGIILAKKNSPAVSSKTAAKKTAEPEAREAVTEKTAVKKKDELKYTGGSSNRDPFGLPEVLAKILAEPKAKKEEKVNLPKIELQGIIWNPARPQAIVNNTVMNPGDMIDNFEIQEITRDGLVLFYNGRTYPVKMQ